MTVHVLRFAGPTQAWPGRARWDTRPTLPAPTYSAVAGFLHACLGQPRPAHGEPWELHPALTGAHIAARVDQPGEPFDDYQTVNPLPDAMFNGDPKAPKPSDLAVVRDGKGSAWMGGTTTAVTRRGYLADAAFTVLVEPAAPHQADQLAAALHQPHHPPYLGRRNSPPAWPWYLGTHHHWDLETAANTTPTITTTPAPYHELHHLQGNPTTQPLHTTNHPTRPLDRPAGRYHPHHVPVTTVDPPNVPTLNDLLTWAHTNLTQPAHA